jgi:hypothetical protein
VTNAVPAGEGLRAGAASVDITPQAGIRLQGYKLRHAEGIADRLSVSALAVGRAAPEWLLFSVDCIGLDRRFTARIRERLSASPGVLPGALTIACSHTHSGPATLPSLGVVAADAEYLALLEEQLVLAAETAVRRMERARWRFGTEELPQNINRRAWVRGRIELGANPAGPVDRRLRVVRVDRLNALEGAPPLALLVHYACHATTSGGVPRLSADWPGVMRQTLQAAYADADHPIPVVVFLQGCAGDVTHRIGRDREAWPGHFERYTAVESAILGRLAAAAAMTASEHSVPADAETLDVIVRPLSLPFHRHRDSEDTELQVVRIGPRAGHPRRAEESIWIIALPGEPFATYGTELGDHLKRRVRATPNNVIVCGYSNDAVGYLCTPRALREGGYEAGRAHEMYHRPAAFAPKTQRLVFDRAAEAAASLLIDRHPSESREASSVRRFGQRLLHWP